MQSKRFSNLEKGGCWMFGENREWNKVVPVSLYVPEQDFPPRFICDLVRQINKSPRFWLLNAIQRMEMEKIENKSKITLKEYNYMRSLWNFVCKKQPI